MARGVKRQPTWVETVARLTDAIKEIPVPKPVAKTQSGEDGLAFLLAKIRGGKDA